MNRRTFLVASLASAALSSAAGAAAAAGIVPFDSKAFAAAQAAGEGIIVFVHAPW
jgi:hypothetical protein